MMDRYYHIIDSFKNWYPTLFEKTEHFQPLGRLSILVHMNDGAKLEYTAHDHAIRDVTRYYDKSNAVDEESWRKEFGRRLRRLISERGISQEKLSETTGISRQMMTRYVKGTSTPSGFTLSRLSEALDCDVRELTRFGYIDED